MPARHSYHRGDVVLVTFPYSGPGGNKDRPAVVLATDGYHDDWDELLVVGLTSRPPKAIRVTDYELQDWQAAGLHQPSWMRSHLATVHRQLIVRRLGTLSSRDFLAAEGCLRLATGL
jgi:mRNA interferase MazF